jgi:alkylation response protein AidB-like acyl-CoA dehydrogenase
VNFDLSASQRRVRDVARDFSQTVIAPRAAEIDRTEAFPRDLLGGLAERGLMAINVDPELGGAGAGAVAYALAIQEIARACASTAVMASVTNMVGETIARFGTEPQKRRHCPRLGRGEHVLGSFALSEPDAGSDPAAMRTTARRDGSDWVIDGAKQWITGGTYAGVLLVWARTAPADPPAALSPDRSAGISCFLVEGGTPGLRLGRPEDKLGIRGSNTVPLEFEACRVPADALLGVEGGGFKIAMSALDGGRIGISAQAIGIARAALAGSIVHVGAQRPPGENASARTPGADNAARLADMHTLVEASHELSMRAAWRKDRGDPYAREAAMAKLFASEAAVRVCNEAVAIHGGLGFLPPGPAERHLRDARVTMIYEGTSEIHRVVIARGLLRS